MYQSIPHIWENPTKIDLSMWNEDMKLRGFRCVDCNQGKVSWGT